MKRSGRRLHSFEIRSAAVSPRTAAAIRRALLSWFKSSGRSFPWRKEGASIYELVVAEILLQRTRAQTIGGFFREFTGRFPSWQAIADTDIDDIANALKPIGLWRRRAWSLSSLAREMAQRNGLFPGSREELESLPGVGQYVASAILLFSGLKREPLLDVNMARVLERLFGPRRLADIRDDPHLQCVSRIIVRGKSAIQLNWALLDLAAVLCKTRDPRCAQCPLSRQCRHASITSRAPRQLRRRFQFDALV
jgi:A/G-specific adenine glycosylase